MKSIADIKAIREKMQSEIILRDSDDAKETRIVVGMATRKVHLIFAIIFPSRVKSCSDCLKTDF